MLNLRIILGAIPVLWKDVRRVDAPAKFIDVLPSALEWYADRYKSNQMQLLHMYYKRYYHWLKLLAETFFLRTPVVSFLVAVPGVSQAPSIIHRESFFAQDSYH